MDTEVVDNDSIDTEALQAQIDLSMSFAQGLVSSWMKSHKLPTNSRKRDLEKELSEYMKRPPRLGVGASVPEGHQNLSREAARLKGKLFGKHLREGEDENALASAKRTLDDDDEDESRAGAIKKKPKSDPFDITHRGKKKKKHHAKIDESEQPTLPESPSLQEVADSLLNGLQSPSNEQKRPKQEFIASDLFLQEAAQKEDPSTTKSEHSSKPESVVMRPSPTSPTPTVVPRNSIHAELLKRPLLNLTGLVNGDDDESDDAEGAATGSPLTTPKKKRKRRRKKKHPITEAECNSTATASVAASTV